MVQTNTNKFYKLTSKDLNKSDLKIISNKVEESSNSDYDSYSDSSVKNKYAGLNPKKTRSKEARIG